MLAVSWRIYEHRAMRQHSLLHWTRGVLTLLIRVGFNVPLCVGITRVVLLGTRDLNLLETPLRQVSVGALQVTAKNLVLETKRSGKGANPATVTRSHIPDNLNLPVIFLIADSQVTIR